MAGIPLSEMLISFAVAVAERSMSPSHLELVFGDAVIANQSSFQLAAGDVGGHGEEKEVVEIGANRNCYH